MIMSAYAEPLASGNGQCAHPVDFDHLKRFTLGNEALEQEVLDLFCRQCSQYVDRLKAAQSGHAWREAAHTIKGSAKGIGAWQVAQTAEYLETLDFEALGEKRSEMIETLDRVLSEAKSYIETVLRRV